ncbi:MAG: nucleotide sugar dehydrogenase [Candidatus Aureabacteria bacterium]|nr:nucleotide sugar dehydrogenase [Candidatus Auribacterota bacterium]
MERRRARVAILGLGYVGLPLAIEFAKAGFPVIGIEIDPARVGMLRRGRSYVQDVPSTELAPLIHDRRLVPTGECDRLAGADVVIICVPTPLRKTKDPDLSYIVRAVEEIARFRRRRQLIVLESTTYPGTCDELILPFLEKDGAAVGRDFFLAFSPERVDPGNPRYGTKNIPKIIGGITRQCTALAGLLYGQVIEKVHPVSSTRVAEMAKLLENTFRSVNIAMVNEMALICDRMGIDVWEVIRAAATKPFGFMPFYPGPGLGGHCLPIDPLYLSWKARVHNFEAHLIEIAAEINERMPEHVLGLLRRTLNRRRRCVRGAPIAVLGVAYKRDVGDTRESPALEIMRMLIRDGALLSYADPYVPSLECEGRRLRAARLTPAFLRRQECVVIITDHRAFDYEAITRHAKVVVDTRNATRNLPRELRKRVVTL